MSLHRRGAENAEAYHFPSAKPRPSARTLRPLRFCGEYRFPNNQLIVIFRSGDHAFVAAIMLASVIAVLRNKHLLGEIMPIRTLIRLRHQLAPVLCLFIALTHHFSISAAAQQRRRAANGPPNPAKVVRLVVGIVIDQFRYDYLTRFRDQFGEGGFKRLMNGGAVFTNANYIHAPTVTACGHATFMSGATPAMNGIIGNEWFDRESGKRITSVADGKVKLVGGREGAAGMSPSRMLGSTIGDELKLASGGQAKVIGVSLKDRSAILPAGKHPNGAYW